MRDHPDARKAICDRIRVDAFLYEQQIVDVIRGWRPRDRASVFSQTPDPPEGTQQPRDVRCLSGRDLLRELRF
jgi:hypothetical protein